MVVTFEQTSSLCSGDNGRFCPRTVLGTGASLAALIAEPRHGR